MNRSAKNILVYLFAAAAVTAAFLVIKQRDDRIMTGWSRNAYSADSTAFRATEEERRIAARFADSTLPEMKRLGLLRTYTRTDIETVITVNGSVWRARSQFFKESFLTQTAVYNRVNGFAAAVKVVDHDTHRLLAEIVPPDRKEFY